MKTNLSNLKQPPIVLERNALLLEVARLQEAVKTKDIELSSFKNELNNVSSKLNTVNQNTSSKEISLTNENLSQKKIISDLRDDKEKLKEELEKKNIIIEQQRLEIEKLKAQLANNNSIVESIFFNSDGEA